MKINELNRNGTQIALKSGAEKWYCNSPQGRAELSAECPPGLVTEVLAVWGDIPTVPNAPPPPGPPRLPSPDPRDLALAQLARDVAALKAKDGATIG